ncbi:zinc finger, CCHC-type containing protein [Tanacetum coccineum]
MAGNNGGKDGQITLHYPMLSRSNYAAWAIKMRVFMQAQGVWEAVEPRTANTVVEVKKDKMALAAIYQGIPEDLLLSLSEKKLAKEAWEALKTMFMGADRVKTARIQTLKAEFESLNMKETEGVDEFAVKVGSAIILDEERMKGNGESEIEKLHLTHQECQKETRKKEKATSNRSQIVVDLEAHEAEAEEEVEIMVVVVVVEVDHTIKEKEVKVHLAVKIRQGSSGLYIEPEYGPYAAGEMQGENSAEGGQRVGTGERVLLNEENVTPQLRTHGAAPNQSRVWYLDTGARNHMTGDKDKFRDLNETLAEGGDEIKIKDPFLWVHDAAGKLVMKVRRSSNRLYKIELEEVNSRCLIAEIRDPTWLWHTRLGHVNFTSLKLMSASGGSNWGRRMCGARMVVLCVLPGSRNLVKVRPIAYCGRGDQWDISRDKHFTKRDSACERAIYLLSYIVSVAERSVPRLLGPSCACILITNSVGHLRVFGCTAHMKIAKNHLKKLEDRSKRVVYLGTEKGSKAHRLLDPDTRSMYVSRDVVFEEDQTWNWEKITKIKAIPGMSFTVEGLDLDEFQEEEIDPEPYTPQNNHDSSYSDSNWTGEEQPIDSPLGSQASSQSTPINQPEEPNTYQEAKDKSDWVNAMKEELSSIERNNTWKLVELPKGRKAIGLKWVYKVKRDPNGRILKYKARIVAKGYVQKQGIDYDEVFAPVARIETVRVILALAGSSGWWVHHLDVKSAFLNGRLEEEVYVMQPEGFEKRNEASKVYKLSKALYGLKQAPRAWNACLDKYLKSLGFTRCYQEYSVYTRKKEGSILIVGVYVDDLARCQCQHETGITLKQEAYAKNILNKTRMMDCNATRSPMEHKLKLSKDEEGELADPTEYRSIVGALRYLTHTRPDLSFTVGVVSRFMEKPTVKHLQAVKRILRYIKGTLSYGLTYTRGENRVTLTGYSDSDFGKDMNDGKSTGGTAFYMNGNLVTWASQKQRSVALSSCEAEFMAATMAACQGIWLRRLLTEITGQKGATFIIVDPVDNRFSSWFDEKTCVPWGKADILTKTMARVKHEEMRDLIGVKPITNSELRGEC